MGWYVGCFYIIWSENYSEKLKIERFLESNHGNRSQHLAFVWKSSSNFELLSSQKFLWYKLETLGIVGSIIWLYCAQILCSSRLHCGRYSSFGDAGFFWSPCISKQKGAVKILVCLLGLHVYEKLSETITDEFPVVSCHFWYVKNI